MDTNEYQEAVKRTMGVETDRRATLCNWAMGLSGEAGEVSEHIKKHVFHGKPLDTALVLKEIGDVFWYAGALCNTLGLTFTAAMEQNIAKLKARYPDGFLKQDDGPTLCHSPGCGTPAVGYCSVHV